MGGPRQIISALLVLGLLGLNTSVLAAGQPARVDVCFSPGQDCESQIAATIGAAQKNIYVQAYGFSSIKILRALRDAAGRGVDVSVLLDKSNRQKRNSGAELMRLSGARVWIDDSVGIAHNKLIIIDGHLVIGGSFNYTKRAQQRNAENVTFIEGQSVAAAFLTNWMSRMAVSTPYTERPPSQEPKLNH